MVYLTGLVEIAPQAMNNNSAPYDGCVYILWLLHSCWYVGYSSTLTKLNVEIDKHKGGRSAAAKWVKKHPVIEVVQVFYNVPQSFEVDTTLQLANKYGWQFVRGGGHTAVDINQLRLPRPLSTVTLDLVVVGCDGIQHLVRRQDLCRFCMLANFWNRRPSPVRIGCDDHGRSWGCEVTSWIVQLATFCCNYLQSDALQTSERHGWCVCGAHFHQVMKVYPFLVDVMTRIQKKNKEVNELADFLMELDGSIESVRNAVLSDIVRKQASLQSMLLVKDGLVNHIMFEVISKCQNRASITSETSGIIVDVNRLNDILRAGHVWRTW